VPGYSFEQRPQNEPFDLQAGIDDKVKDIVTVKALSLA